MRMQILAFSSLLLLGGCMHYARFMSSDFNRGNASTTQFARDNYECRTSAVVGENMAGGGGDLRGGYHRDAERGMRKRRHVSTEIARTGFGG